MDVLSRTVDLWVWLLLKTLPFVVVASLGALFLWRASVAVIKPWKDQLQRDWVRCHNLRERVAAQHPNNAFDFPLCQCDACYNRRHPTVSTWQP